jgi:hypothetical protein
MITNKYYIGKDETTKFNIIKLATDMGWVIDKRVSDFEFAIEDAIVFLKSKGINVWMLIEKSPDNPATAPTVLLPEKTSENVKVDNDILRCYNGSSIYSVDTTLLGDECWDVQIFGIMGCVGCDYRNNEACYGKVTLGSGVNSLGNKIPIAVRLYDRPERKGNIEVDPNVIIL